jgi:hypothetical protein
MKRLNHFEIAVKAYKYMQEHGITRNGLWLESNNYDIEFLRGYRDEAVIFDGKAAEISSAIGVPYSTTIQLMQRMVASGSLIRLRRSMYALIEEPTEELINAYKDRTLYGMNQSKKSGARSYAEQQFAAVYRQLDDLKAQVSDLRAEISDLRGAHGKKDTPLRTTYK